MTRNALDAVYGLALCAVLLVAGIAAALYSGRGRADDDDDPPPPR